MMKTDEEIAEMILQFRKDRDEAMLQLQIQADGAVNLCESRISVALAVNGRQRCPWCEGRGAIARLDAGWRRRFGLCEWKGCEHCGGDGEEKRGCGFVKREDGNEKR